MQAACNDPGMALMLARLYGEGATVRLAEVTVHTELGLRPIDFKQALKAGG